MIKKISQKISAIPVKGIFGKIYNYINTSGYMRYYTKYLRKLGININGTPKYISSDAYFDGNDYSKISLGDNVTVSRETMFLTHDYSITTAMASIGRRIERGEGEVYFSRPITIGNNVFIGARASILPGTEVGDNCIIGAGCVVKGSVPADSIVVGNPAKIIGSVSAFAEKHSAAQDYLIEK